MTSDALPDALRDARPDALERDRRRRESVATADRVFATLLDDVEAVRGRRTAALRHLGAAPGVPPGRTADAVPAPHDPPAVALAGRPGVSATGSLWVHNVGAVAVQALALRLTELTTDDGAAIDAARGTLRPDRVDVGPGASAEVRVTVAVPGDAVPGVYHGQVRGERLPGTSAVPVRLVVDP